MGGAGGGGERRRWGFFCFLKAVVEEASLENDSGGYNEELGKCSQEGCSLS